MSNHNLKLCRICGHENESYPWGPSGDKPSFRLCPCCGVEFGTEDAELPMLTEYRRLWLEDGGQWLDEEECPDDFCLAEQLKNIPQKWR